MNEQYCENCLYWKGSIDDIHHQGECRRYPPRFDLSRYADEIIDKLAANYDSYNVDNVMCEVMNFAQLSKSPTWYAHSHPYTTDGDWCGEWKEKIYDSV